MGEKNIQTIGLIAGGGNLPITILKDCTNRGIKPYVILLKTFAKKENYEGFTNIEINFGHIGKAIDFFKKHNVKQIIFAGSIKKPDLHKILPDLKGFSLLFKLLQCKLLGDNKISKIVINFLEKEGFEIIPVNQFIDTLKIPEGIVGKIKLPTESYKNDIEYGKLILKKISDFDIGQSIVIQNGIALGMECVEGTEKLIERCGNLKYSSGRKPILVKMAKMGQTKKIDLPAIGKDTINQVKAAGFAGIAFDCENGVAIDKEEVISMANKNNIFIYGIKY